MNGHDEAIEQVLKALRDAEAPAGMEDRILLRLESRTLTARTSRARSGALASIRAWPLNPIAWIGGMATLASGVALVSYLHSTRPPRAIAGRTAPPALAVPFYPSKPPHEFAIPAANSSPRLNLRAHLVQTAPPSDEDALALSEMLAPSKPAPPLPLTHQEVLLAQVVHHGDPGELAELRPEVRAKQVEIARAEFHDYFEPPSPVKNTE